MNPQSNRVGVARKSCEFCHKEFLASNLSRHTRIHLAKKEFKCTLCTFSTHRKDHLYEHIATHTREKPYNCRAQCFLPGCRYETNFQYKLTKHWKADLTLNKPFSCALCPCQAKTKDNLQSHQKFLHSIERPFKCQQPNCSSSFKTKYHLKRHLRGHSGKKPFVCLDPGCGYKSKTLDDLKAHGKIHSGEKLFKCTFCPFSCRVKASLTVHIRDHAGDNRGSS